MTPRPDQNDGTSSTLLLSDRITRLLECIHKEFIASFPVPFHSSTTGSF